MRYAFLVLFIFMSSLLGTAADQVLTISAVEDARCVECDGVRKNMSLTCKWYTINVSDCPVTLSNLGILTRGSGCLQYSAVGKVDVKTDINALVTKFALYDVFNQHLVNLASRDVFEMHVGTYNFDGTNPPFEGRWNIPSYVNSDELLIVIAYPEKARLKSGEVWQINFDKLTERAREVVPTAEFRPDSTKNLH